MNRIYLIRHGENVANLTKEFSSRRVDYSLTPKGVLQAQQTAEHLAGRTIHAVYSSPLKRARETAGIIAARLGLPSVVMDNFREIDVGDMEGQPPTPEAWALHNQIVGGWLLRGQVDRAFPNGDSGVTLRRRMRAGIEQIVAGREDQNLVVVAHGGIMIVSLPDLCPGIDIERLLSAGNNNCSITEILVGWRDGRLEGELLTWASYDHLSGAAADLVPGIPE
jgi:broad specificity phosphatase PhoE